VQLKHLIAQNIEAEKPQADVNGLAGRCYAVCSGPITNAMW
jgi:hypothetical protein